MGHQSPTNLVSWISVHRCGYPELLLQKVGYGIQLLGHTEVKVMISWGDVLSCKHAKEIPRLSHPRETHQEQADS